MPTRVTILLDSLALGGAQRHSLSLARQLEGLGITVSLVVFSRTRSSAIRDDDLPHLTTILGRGSMNLDPLGWLLAGRAIAAFDPMVVIAVDPAALAIAGIAKALRLYRGRLACLLHVFRMPSPRERRRLPLFKMLLGLADTIVYVSEYQRREWRPRLDWRKPDHVIRNGIDLEAFDSPDPGLRARVRAALDIDEGDFVIGVIAQFRPEKNHQLLVRACERLRTEQSAFKVIFVGDGTGRANIEAQVVAAGLRDHARFVGEQADIRPYLAAMDCTALSSVSETLPMVALETLASHLPVVLPNVGGTPEIVVSGANGHLFPLENVEALADCLSRLMDPVAREAMRSQCRASAETFDEREMGAEFVKLISALAAQSRPHTVNSSHVR